MIAQRLLLAFSLAASVFFFGLAYIDNTPTEPTTLSMKVYKTHRDAVLERHEFFFDRTREIQNLIASANRKQLSYEDLEKSLILYNSDGVYKSSTDAVQSLSSKTDLHPYISPQEAMNTNTLVFAKLPKNKQGMLAYSYIFSMPDEKKTATTYVESFSLRHSYLRDFLNRYRFNYIVIGRDKNNNWDVLNTSLSETDSQDILRLVQNDNLTRFYRFEHLEGNAISAFDMNYKDSKLEIHPFPLKASKDKEQAVLYVFNYPKDITVAQIHKLIIGVFTLSLLITFIGYALSRPNEVNS